MSCNNDSIDLASSAKPAPGLLLHETPCDADSPISSLEKLRIARRRRSSQFSKRRKTILRKAHDLHKDCDVDIYFVVRSRQNNQIWRYSNGYFPPSTLEEIYPVPITLSPQDFQSK
ncbi:MADS-box domain-containing protein [Trichoderma simmonsii]|uniref:MADS-box domain-containing protein n=1 Tax=Trichoderma simmonsii TaxID=1491479 RepID=A0A8G0PQC6_9HYPO|nr:MADS-box domain-containing protein [Trichoderma simmonsii]